MSKIRNTPHVYVRSTKRLGINWLPGNADGFHSPAMTQREKDRIRAAVLSGK